MYGLCKQRFEGQVRRVMSGGMIPFLRASYLEHTAWFCHEYKERLILIFAKNEYFSSLEDGSDVPKPILMTLARILLSEIESVVAEENNEYWLTFILQVQISVSESLAELLPNYSQEKMDLVETCYNLLGTPQFVDVPGTMFRAKRSELRTALTKGQFFHSVQAVGDRHPDSMRLGALLTDHMRDQYRQQSESFGPQHPNTIVATSEYAYHLINYEDDITGERLLTNVLQRTRTMLGPGHF